MNNDAYHLLIIDDDPILQSYLAIKFTELGYKISQLTQGEDIEQVLVKKPVNLIILDVMLEGKNGFFWLQWLKKHHPRIDVLMLTANKSEDDRIQGLELGALDFLPKPFSIKELSLRVKNILQRSPHQQTVLITFGAFCFNTRLKTLSKDSQPIKLTHYETELLAVFCQNQNQIITRDQLSQALNGSEHAPLDRRIDVHINRLRNKIEQIPSAPDYIHTVWGKGYRFQLPELEPQKPFNAPTNDRRREDRRKT